jgi:hypothetical protein
MPLVGKSLDAATTVGPGEAILFDTPKKTVTMQAISTASDSSYAIVDLEVTIDRQNFFAVAEIFRLGAQSWATSTTFAVIGARANLRGLNVDNAPVTATIAAA